jgi:hypothetical protein
MTTAAKRDARDDVEEIEIGITCRGIETGTTRGEDVGEEGTVVVDGKGEAAVMVERDGKAGTITGDKT